MNELSEMKPYGEFGTFIKTVKNVKHKQELIEAANPVRFFTSTTKITK